MRIGDFVCFTRAHGKNFREPAWGMIEKRLTGRQCVGVNTLDSGCTARARGTIVAGPTPSGTWSPRSEFTVQDPVERSRAWTENNIRCTVVKPEDVPGEVWAEVAKRALSGEDP